MGLLSGLFTRAPEPEPLVEPAGALHLHTVDTDHAIVVGSILLLAVAHFVIGRARNPPPGVARAIKRLSRRLSSLVGAAEEGKPARRVSIVPWDPHPKWSAAPAASTRSGVYPGWRFFALLLVGLVVVIFEGSFETVRLFYTTCSLSLMAYRLKYYADRGLLLYALDFCYWVHFVGLAALWFADLPSDWATAALVSAVGPVGGAVFMLQSPLLLHHPEAFEGFFLHVVPCWVAYVVRWRVMPSLAPELLPVGATIGLGFWKVYVPWGISHLLFLLVKPYTPLAKYEMLFDWYVGSVASGDNSSARGKGAKAHDSFLSYAWKPTAYIAVHALLSLEGYAAAALSLRREACFLAWVSLIFALNIKTAFDFYRAGTDPDYSPGNKFVNGLRDSALSWCVILPLFLWCEREAV
mmetsp:Transcript_15487/g.48055  ORF Transcript_15487/g.48055 Transcript_15487/m.48055 type:complete len:409 (+) Transcript_15487:184-1410(+)